MDNLLNHGLMFLAGLVVLAAGAETLVRGASRLALSFGVSPLVVGLTVVAFGTSAPELSVSVGAVLSGTTDLALANAVGSNIFNVLFILGLSALITPLFVHRQIIRQEAPVMVGAAFLLWFFASDGTLTILDSAILFGLVVLYTIFLIVRARAEGREQKDGPPALLDSASSKPRLWVQSLLVIVALALLAAGSHLLVSGATGAARALGVSDVVIGLTIVAAGTSLPEVATSVIAALRRERDIAVGNIVGSCIFNLSAVVGASGLATILTTSGGLPVPREVLDFDLWVMIAVLVACIPVFISGRQIARWEGALFLAYYAAYTVYLIMAAQRHEGLEAFSDAMIFFVIPLTIVTLVATMLRRRE